MEAYTGFASVYDRYMDNVPYDAWAENIKVLFEKYNMPMEIVCDLGCGTGQITRRLKAQGYDMIGIDVSYDMLMRRWHRRIPRESFIYVRICVSLSFMVQ